MTETATNANALSQQSTSPLLLGADQMAGEFNRQAFSFKHRLADDVLFTLPKLVELSKRLPPERVEHNIGDLDIAQRPDSVRGNGLSVADTIAQIQDCKSWLVLKHVQTDPAYAALLNRCLDQVETLLPPTVKTLFSRVGFIFVSSPGSVTPFHIDPENNFLLQIRGNKKLQVFAAEDRDAVSEQALEQFYSGGHRNLDMPDGGIERARSIELASGDGLHVPQHAPHYVVNGDDVSVSFSITFQTAASDTVQGVYWCNGRLRALGLNPTSPGRFRWLDTSKYLAYAGLRGVKRRLSK